MMQCILIIYKVFGPNGCLLSYFQVHQNTSKMSMNNHQTELPKAAFPIIINKLLEFDTQGFKGCLFWAAENGYVDIYKLLMEKVDDKNPTDSSGTTPLHVAAKKGHLEICQLIMENIVDKNPADINGKTPLHEAARNGRLDICGFFLQNLKEKNPKMRNGLTPTHLAASNNYLDVCRMITKSLDDQNPTSNKWGSTVLTYSEENDRIDVVDIDKVKSRTDICKVHGISCHLNSRSFIKRLKFQILNMRQVSTDSSSSETFDIEAMIREHFRRRQQQNDF